jgi:colanic acid biosynthesis glycosyl transferase WcaI
VDILLLNQAFYPDVAATAQYASDLAAKLVDRGHRVTVVASSRGYADPSARFASSERWQGVQILRCPATSFGKGARWRRAADFATFFVACVARVAVLPRFDAVVALTSPPLISVLGAVVARLNGARFIHWMMDLNPDEAVAAGWLRPGSKAVRALNAALRFSLRRSDQVVALDRFMADRLTQKGVPVGRLAVIPPWSHADTVAYDSAGAAKFRNAHGLDGKFVVMYSGNHSPCHPLDTFLKAALRLRDHCQIVFCFVGGGSEFPRVIQFARTYGLDNIRWIPYQPLAALSASLSAADLHAVAMGDSFVGIVHPSKVYNIRRLGIPFLYVGPSVSPVADFTPAGSFRHGDVRGVADFIAAASEKGLSRSADGGSKPVVRLSLEHLISTIGG